MINEKTNQAMHKAIVYFPLTDAQSDPEQQPPPHPSSPQFYCHAWCRMSLWAAWASCPDPVPSQLLVCSQPPR